MKEKILTRKYGMPVLLGEIVLCLLIIADIVYSTMLADRMESSRLSVVMFGIGLVLAFLCWIPLLGLRVLNPQEALGLTLFGK